MLIDYSVSGSVRIDILIPYSKAMLQEDAKMVLFPMPRTPPRQEPGWNAENERETSLSELDTESPDQERTRNGSSKVQHTIHFGSLYQQYSTNDNQIILDKPSSPWNNMSSKKTWLDSVV